MDKNYAEGGQVKIFLHPALILGYLFALYVLKGDLLRGLLLACRGEWGIHIEASFFITFNLRSEDFMADFNSTAYKTPINNYPKGQCTWYAFGRIYEKTGKKLLVSGNAGEWYESSPLSRQYWKAASNTVACWSGGSGNYGHVGVVEKVYQDGSLDYSEANYDGDGILNTSVDGKIMHFNSVDAMKKRFGSSFTFEGYLCVY